MADAEVSPKRMAPLTLSSELQFDNSAFDPNRGGVGAVVGA
jgi:hypothetical protein